MSDILFFFEVQQVLELCVYNQSIPGNEIFNSVSQNLKSKIQRIICS